MINENCKNQCKSYRQGIHKYITTKQTLNQKKEEKEAEHYRLECRGKKSEGKVSSRERKKSERQQV